MHRDLIGQIFGNLKVIEYAGTRGKVAYWRCACTCGNIVEVRAIHLTKGATKSCGCLKKQKAHNRQDLTGQRFGKLTVLKEDGLKNKKFKWLCLCDCGTTVSVSAYHLTKGKTKSCGCLKKQESNRRVSVEGKKFGDLLVLQQFYATNKRAVCRCICSCGKTVDIARDNLVQGRQVTCGHIAHSDTSILAQEVNRANQTVVQAKCKLFGRNIKYLSADQTDIIKDYFKRTENSHYSYAEKEIVAYIKSIYKGEVIENDRDLIAPKELDIYIPEKKLAIEYNGLIWHCSKFNDDKYYHLNKTKACEEKGVRLIHIFSCLWKSKKEIIKSMLASALGVYEQKEYARELEVREVTDRQAINKFFDENHMQGSIKTWSYGIGLFKGEELLQACLFGGKRFKGEKATELLRMATKLNTQVIGGFSKLMKHCPYDSVVSYVHRTYFNGTGYLVGNWKLEGYTEPELYYTDGKDIYSRHLFNKEAMKKRWCDIDETKTQREIAEEHGFYQLYGSGNIKVRWTR